MRRIPRQRYVQRCRLVRGNVIDACSRAPAQGGRAGVGPSARYRMPAAAKTLITSGPRLIIEPRPAAWPRRGAPVIRDQKSGVTWGS